MALPYLLSVLTRRRKYGKVQVITQIVVNIMNNIIIPCLVVAVVSPNCFYNALVAAPPVVSSATYTACQRVLLKTGECLQADQIPSLTSFDPPFTYNYQCSSSLITYYSPAFVSMCIVSIFVTPLVQYVCQWLHIRATPGTNVHRLLTYALPRVMKPVSMEAGIVRKGYLNTDGLMTTLICMLGLILTFGVMFPPLCIAFSVSIFVILTLFRWNMIKHLSCATDNQRVWLEEIFLSECSTVNSMRILKDSVWVLVTVSCWFYTLFLFDTLGDAVVFERAYWVLIVMPLMPLVLYVVHCVVLKCVADKQQSNSSPMEVELQATGEEGSCSVVHNVLIEERG